MIQIYGYPNTRTTRVTWMLEELEELEQDYQFSLVDFMKAENQEEPFISINPAGKVPVMKENDFVLTESAAIVSYLGEKFPERELIPPSGTRDKALYNQWLCFVIAELEQPLWTISKHKFALPKEVRKPEVQSTAEWEYQKALYILSEGLGNNNYILGHSFSAADILITQTLNWGTSFNQLTVQDNLLAYAQRLNQRDALKRALQKQKA